MVQIHGNTILPMGFNPIVKAHDLNPWQIIYQKVQFPLAISKAQFPLATSKAQFSLVISKAQFMLALFYQKPKIINAWQEILCLNQMNNVSKTLLLQKPWQSFYKSS